MTPADDPRAAKAVVLGGCLLAVVFFAAGFVFALLVLTILMR